MGKERMPHDSAYKQFSSNSEMVESLLRDFVSADFIADLDFSTLERCSGSYVTDDLRERHDDIVWRVGWKKGSWCYVALLLEFQSTPDHWMALRMLSYTTLRLLDLVKMVNIRENEGLYLVFPHCYIQWRQGMESAPGSGGLVRSDAGGFEVLSSSTSAFFAGRKPCVGRRTG